MSEAILELTAAIRRIDLDMKDAETNKSMYLHQRLVADQNLTLAVASMDSLAKRRAELVEAKEILIANRGSE